MKLIKIPENIYPERDLIESIGRRLRRGEVGVLPTDTIYGFHARFDCMECVLRIDRIKKKDSSKRSYLMLISDFSFFEKYGVKISKKIKSLCELYWPGQLTLLFETEYNFPEWCLSENGKIGVRMPSLPFLREIIRECGFPIISTSVNESGKMPLTNISAIVNKFGESVDFIVDSGNLELSSPSTVLDVSGDTPFVVREGVIPSSVIKSFFRG